MRKGRKNGRKKATAHERYGFAKNQKIYVQNLIFSV